MKNLIVNSYFSKGYIFGEICSKNQNCLLKLKFRTYINLNMQNSKVIFIFFFLGRKYPFCVNVIQKFSRLSRNLVPTLQYLVDVPPSPLIKFSVFSIQDIFIPTPTLINYWVKFPTERNFLKQYTYADFFAFSQKE